MERSPSGYLPRYPHFDQVFGKPSTLSEPLRALDLDVSRAAAITHSRYLLIWPMPLLRFKDILKLGGLIRQENDLIMSGITI